MVRTLFSSFAAIPAGTGWLSLPLGPSARIRPSSIWTLTPWGIVIGCLPMRDMSDPSPHVGEHFAAHALLAGVAIGQHAAGGGEQGHAHPAEDRGDLVVGDVDPPPRRRDPHEARDHLLGAGAVLEIDPQRALLVVVEHPKVLDEPLVLEDLGHPDLELGGGDVDFLVLGPATVADAGEQIGDRVASHRMVLTSSPSGRPAPRP